jgi:hypothetical protein
MRSIRADYLAASQDVRFVTICQEGSDSSNVEGYASSDVDGEDPPPSVWPIVIDTVPEDVIGRYCGLVNEYIVIGTDGVVTFQKPIDLTIPAERQSLIHAIDTALGL